MASSDLTSQQANALFDILSHHATYAEIVRFKYPAAIEDYGPPFEIEQGKSSESPILQTLLYRFVLSLPGLKDVNPDFWHKRCEDLVKKFGEAELSESYDKGALGSRKTLATAISTVIEYPTRGVLGGLPKRPPKVDNDQYDISDPEELHDAWEDFVQDLVYGDMIEQLRQKMGETDQLSEHPMRVQAAHEFILINIASFMHYVMILSPDGPYLTRVLENIHRLIPYTMMRSTLRIGNAATMINGMVKLLLTKISLNSVTSWIGLTHYSDSGMNMLQQIASTVIGWDISELHRQSYKAEKAKDAPPKEHINAIKEHMKASREVRDKRRETSEKEEKSMAQAIFDDSDIKTELPVDQHSRAMDFLSIQLSIRDREQISNILCSLNPDILTHAVRDAVAAYDPVIRSCHNAVDLSTTLGDYESFLTDFIRLSKGSEPSSSRPSTPRLIPSRPGTPKPGQGRKSGEESHKSLLPSVEDYIKLFKKHQSSVHRFLHQVVKNDKKLADEWVKYAKDAASQFRQDNEDRPVGAAGDMTPALQNLFSKLPEDQKRAVVDALDNYSAYTMALQSTSRDRWNAALSSALSSGTHSRDSNSHHHHTHHAGSHHHHQNHIGPGIYLAKWQQLLDTTPITPATPHGPVRHGRDRSVRDKAGVGVETSGVSGASSERVRAVVERDVPEAPDVSVVVDLLSPGFKELVQERGKKVWEGKE